MLDNLATCSERFLTLVAGMMSERDAIVVTTERVKLPITVAFDSRTLVLDPRRIGLLDLAVAARALQWRRQAEQRCNDQGTLFPTAALRFILAAWESLLHDYPKIGRLPGRFDPRRQTTWPKLTMRDVKFTKPVRAGGAGAAASFLRTEGLDVTGAKSDFTWLLREIAAGRYPLEDWPTLPELPIVTVPLQIATGRAPGPQFEEYRRHLDDPEIRKLIGGLKKCYTRKSEGDAPFEYHGARRTTGLHLDTQRLVQAVLMRKAGVPPRVFKTRDQQPQPIWDPRQHLVVIAFDANCMVPGALEGRRFSFRSLSIFLEAYKQMGVDCVVLSYLDHVVRLKDGRRVYLHLPAVLKRVEDSFDGAFYNRLASLLELPPQLPRGEPACFHPLLLRSIRQIFDQQSQRAKYRYRTTLVAATRGMPRGGEYQSDAFLARTAEALETGLNELDSRYEGRFDGEAMFIPYELKTIARPGSRVSQMF